MPVLLGSDVWGQPMKKNTGDLLTQKGMDVFDMGIVSEANAYIVGSVIHNNPGWIAVVFCQNPNCLSILLNNHYTNVRAVVATDNVEDLVQAKRRHGLQANVLCISSPVTNPAHWVGTLVNDFVLV